MRKQIATGTFKPTLSRVDTKNDATTRAAREISKKEAAARIEKTERLRNARLAKEATVAPNAIATKARKRAR
ncbi:hypothetical protein [Mesorhizobium marinum]|uniref:hypothetical protein n=1 Tax=Mesorhizobium marinum TaxID=3228790 RepID=UPI0034667736